MQESPQEPPQESPAEQRAPYDPMPHGRPEVGVGPWEGPWPEGEQYDARLLTDAGYHLAGTTLVDLFPHTAHVELVSRFDRVVR